jgi:hypothetical protein
MGPGTNMEIMEMRKIYSPYRNDSQNINDLEILSPRRESKQGFSFVQLEG